MNIVIVDCVCNIGQTKEGGVFLRRPTVPTPAYRKNKNKSALNQ